MMEYVIKIIDSETKEVDWYKDGSAFFEITDDISQAKRFESEIDAYGKMEELKKRCPEYLFYVTVYTDAMCKFRYVIQSYNKETGADVTYYSVTGCACTSIIDAKIYASIEDTKKDLQYVHEKIVVFENYEVCVKDIITDKIVYKYGDDGITKNGDAVNHPKHYQDPSGIECIDIVRHRNFDIGNAIKYLWRAGLKQDADKTPIEKQIEDLRKAIWYIEDEIKTLEAKKGELNR